MWIWYPPALLLRQTPVLARTEGSFSAGDPWNDGRQAQFAIEVHKMAQKAAAEAIARNNKLLQANNKLLLGADLFSIRSSIDGRSHRLPESLSELLRTGRVASNALPRLLHELEPSLRKSDYWPLLHSRRLEWFGGCFGLGSFAFFAWIALIIPREALDTGITLILAASMAVTFAIFPLTLVLARHWRNRRRQQMAAMLASDARPPQAPERAVEPPAKPAPPATKPQKPAPSKNPADRSELKSTSPGGRYQIRVHPWEARMSHWVETPQLIDTRDNQTLFHPGDTWSMDGAVWQSESLVTLRMRKYPGDHQPGFFEVHIDCANRTASIGRALATSISRIEGQLESVYLIGKSL
jgi:hypothetical protein